ncbi:gamma-glutamyl-gamma-aminobutyrate hydrolase family protein [Nicoliella spurrieriana]|uniref:Gamma-glutamyl-gamma-aminobutyrate hydrolase family protein n=1 Tax=Nicoliella spurrieriana TaxID=2925830 RepID=A0A976X6A5_9LACO|nr:gamma-glutamyl-gamma-aminobutyrate hydrolase family protein [Nicoliella spurrieriana]UQS87344.1 gamma-glutamyl-gamma-aminobutyrate hydrolase family protein [Nicoliella spurrieriana]
MRIGITADVNMTQNTSFRLTRAHIAQRTLVNALVANDIVPVVFPVVKPAMAKELLETVDGIIMTGGPDVAPVFYNEEPTANTGMSYLPRDYFELQLVKDAVAMHKPILAICRGLQMVNVALGGTLFQDLNSQFHPTGSQPLIQHTQQAKVFMPTHHINVAADSQMGQSVGTHPLVNSIHHQAAKQVAPSLHVTATAPDGVIEGLENDDASIQCVQWHPENIWKHMPEENQLLVDFFTRAAQMKN